MNSAGDALAVGCPSATNSGRREKKVRRKKRSWCQDWLKGKTESYCPSKLKFVPEDWHNYLGLDEQTYLKLLALVTPRIQKKNTIMRAAIPPHERLTATLRYLATGQSFEDLKFVTSISPQALGRIIPETCEAIYKVLHKEYLKFPQTEEEWKIIARDFEEKWDFPHCLGAMDVRHVSINPPARSAPTFLNYKGMYSMALLAIANANHEFILCDFGTNGRASNRGVLKNTKFFKKLQQRKLNIPGSSEVGKSEHDLPFVFAADDGFPLRKDVMKPFKQEDVISENRETYNRRFYPARRIIENVFAILITRFRILQMIVNLQPHKIESVVMACCVLHNFLSRSAPSYYSPPVCFLQENIEAATTISELDALSPVCFLRENIETATTELDNPNSSILGFDENNPCNAVLSAEIVRERFVNYFVTDGLVPQESNFI